MIYLCPFCGRPLGRNLTDGFTTCCNCKRVFDSSRYHKVLAAAWVARRENIWDAEILKKCDISPEDAEIIIDYIRVKDYSHEEFLKSDFIKEFLLEKSL